MNERIAQFLSTLTEEELKLVPTMVADMKRNAKAAEMQLKIEKAIEMYNELNLLGKRMYTVNQCAEYVGIGKVTLAKAIQQLETTTEQAVEQKEETV